MKVISYKDSLFRGNIYRSLDIAASGMTVQRKRMDAISANIANVSVTNVDDNSNPYLRRHVVMKPAPDQVFNTELRKAELNLIQSSVGHMTSMGTIRKKMEETPMVEGEQIEIPNERKNVVHDPSHPDADQDGFVVYPDINIIEEMVDLMVASRAFEANVTVVNAGKEMISKSLEI